jgi:hypothetical protein
MVWRGALRKGRKHRTFPYGDGMFHLWLCLYYSYGSLRRISLEEQNPYFKFDLGILDINVDRSKGDVTPAHVVLNYPYWAFEWLCPVP